MIGRFINGMAIGIYYMIIPIILVELSPSFRRGALTTLAPLFINVGVFFGRAMGYYVMPGDFIYTLLVIFPLITCFGGLWKMMDTPNSLIERGLDDKGLEILKLIR